MRSKPLDSKLYYSHIQALTEPYSRLVERATINNKTGSDTMSEQEQLSTQTAGTETQNEPWEVVKEKKITAKAKKKQKEKEHFDEIMAGYAGHLFDFMFAASNEAGVYFSATSYLGLMHRQKASLVFDFNSDYSIASKALYEEFCFVDETLPEVTVIVYGKKYKARVFELCLCPDLNNEDDEMATIMCAYPVGIDIGNSDGTLAYGVDLILGKNFIHKYNWKIEGEMYSAFTKEPLTRAQYERMFKKKRKPRNPQAKRMKDISITYGR